MPGSAVVSVWVEIVGFDHGLWCLRCNRSTGMRAHLASTIGSRVTMSTADRCVECGSREVAA